MTLTRIVNRLAIDRALSKPCDRSNRHPDHVQCSRQPELSAGLQSAKERGDEAPFKARPPLASSDILSSGQVSIVGEDVHGTPRVVLLYPTDDQNLLGGDEPGHPRRDLFFFDVFLVTNIRLSRGSLF